MHVSMFSRSLIFMSVCSVFFLEAAEKKDQTKGLKIMNDSSLKPAATSKIAVVNMYQIFASDPKGLATASDEWRTLFNEIQEQLKPVKTEIEELDGKYKKLRAELVELEKKGVGEIEALQKSKIASEKTLREKSEALQAKLEEKYVREVRPIEMQLRNQVMQAEQFFKGALDEAQAKIATKIDKISEEIQESQGWDIILKGEVALGKVNKRFDLTDEVLRVLNKRYAQEKAEKKPKAPAAAPAA